MAKKETKKLPSGRDPFLRQEPQNPDTERALLGAILRQGSKFATVHPILRPSHFGFEFHQNIYFAFCDLYSRKEVIDTLSVSTWMQQEGFLIPPEGDTTITKTDPKIAELASHEAYTEVDVVTLSKRIKKWSALREIIRVSKVAIDEACQSDEPSEVITVTIKDLLKINTSDTDYMIHISTAAQNFLAKYEEPKERKAQRYADTGFRELDLRMGGVPEGSCVVIVARPKIGKSTLAMQWVMHEANTTNNASIYFLLEMDNELLFRRWVQQHTGLPINQFLSGKKSPNLQEDALIRRWIRELREKNIYIIDKGCNSVSQMRAYVYQFMAKHPDKRIGWIVADHWNLFDTSHGRTEVEAQQRNAFEFNDMIKEVGARGLVPAQCRKPDPGKEKTVPNLYEIKGSGALGEIAHDVIIVHRPNKGTGVLNASESCQIIYEAGREARDGGTLNIHYNPRTLLFGEGFAT